MSFVHRETTEVDFFHGNFVKTNSINGKSEKIHFQIGITKKAVLIKWSSMRLKSVKWNFLGKVCVYDFFENRFLWLKFCGYRFGWKKNQWKAIELIWSQWKWISSKEVFGNLFLRSRIDENCLHQWWKKNQNIFNEGISRWNDFIQVQCVETCFLESKSRRVDMIDVKTMETNFVYRKARPTNFIHK